MVGWIASINRKLFHMNFLNLFIFLLTLRSSNGKHLLVRITILF